MTNSQFLLPKQTGLFVPAQIRIEDFPVGLVVVIINGLSLPMIQGLFIDRLHLAKLMDNTHFRPRNQDLSSSQGTVSGVSMQENSSHTRWLRGYATEQPRRRVARSWLPAALRMNSSWARTGMCSALDQTGISS